ncbi:MAG: formylglycine-generating enzyme family protein [Phycisphaerales bacterium]
MASAINRQPTFRTPWYSRPIAGGLGAAVLAVALAAGCAGDGAPQPIPDATANVTALQPFEQAIEGTPLKFTMVPVPASRTAIQGADGTLHWSDVGPLWIGATEITWELYDLYVFGLDQGEVLPAGTDAVTRPSKPYIPPDRGFGHAGYPAMSMSYAGAEGFCRWLSAKTGRKYRLPSEAEWEHAARAGESDAARETLDARAWHEGNAAGKTHPVGAKSANAWGVHDMQGNVAEWVAGVDGKPVTRGGSYRGAVETLRLDARVRPSPAWNASDPQIPKSKWWLADGPFVGFRVVCEKGN